MSEVVQAWIGRTRSVILVVTAGLAVGVAVVSSIDLRLDAVPQLVPAVGSLFGVTALPIGWHLHRRLVSQVADASDRARGASLFRATIAALGVTEASAVLGVVIWGLSGEAFSLLGVASHLVLTGAIWPTVERWEATREARP